MMNKLMILLAGLIVMAMVLVGCGGSAATAPQFDAFSRGVGESAAAAPAAPAAPAMAPQAPAARPAPTAIPVAASEKVVEVEEFEVEGHSIRDESSGVVEFSEEAGGAGGAEPNHRAYGEC